MTIPTTRLVAPGILVLLPVACLFALLAAHEPLGIRADPVRIVEVFFAACLALTLAARYPAAFVAPVLFIPRLKDIPAFSGLGPAENWTGLQVAVGLLCFGTFLRLAKVLVSPRCPDTSYSEYSSREDAASASRLQYPGQPAIAFLLFAALVAASYAYTPSPNYGGSKLLGFLTLGVGLFFAPVLIFQGKRDFRDFTFGTILFGLVVSASSLSFSATGALGAAANPAHIGKGQVVGLAMLLLLFAPIAPRRLRIFVLLSCIPWMALGMVSAETRGPLLSLLLVLLMGYFIPAMRSATVSRRHMAFAAAALAGAVVILSAFWFYGLEASRFRSKSDEMIALVRDLGEAHGTATMRLEYYGAAVDIALDRPLLGWGVGGWSNVFWQRDFRQYPHNLFFEALVEQGLIGLSVLVYFLFSVFRTLRASFSDISHRFPALLPCLVYLLFISMFSGDIDDNRYIWFWCGLTLTTCHLAARAVHSHLSRARQQHSPDLQQSSAREHGILAN
jgi:O-antigen ligase